MVGEAVSEAVDGAGVESAACRETKARAATKAVPATQRRVLGIMIKMVLPI